MAFYESSTCRCPCFQQPKGCGWISERKALDDFIITNNCSHQDKDGLITFPGQKYQGNPKGTFPFDVPHCLQCFGRLWYRAVPKAGCEPKRTWGGVKAAIRGGALRLSEHWCPRMEMLCQQHPSSNLMHGFISLTACGQGLSLVVPISLSDA